MEAENILTQTPNANAYASASSDKQFSSGRINPNLDSKLTAWVINPFVKFHGLEIFGNYEVAKGTSKSEESAQVVTPGSNTAVRDALSRARQLEERTWTQMAADVIYRFGDTENFWVGGRYNTVSGRPVSTPKMVYTKDITVDRIAVSGGWFMTKSIMAKLEYVQQTYSDLPTNNILDGGEFSGIMLEAVVGF
ncbi:MAG: hypothetical protein J0L62_09280 [Bacteroidetes bacterium]|nr:hypothetical protein [Bacteroidota bacterium]